MIIDAKTLSNGESLSADICIIGAGAAGITLAKEFSKGTNQVIVLESGGLEADTDTQALYDGESVGYDNTIPLMRLRYFGGTTNHWANWCRPMDPIDFEPRPWVADSGWPFKYSHLLPYYKRAQIFCQLGPYNYSSQYWQEKSGYPKLPLNEEIIRSEIFHFRIPKLRFGPEFEQDLRKAKNIKVLLHANMLEFEKKNNENKIEKLHAQSLRGPSFTIRSKFYILATGGIENARLLLLSAKKENSGINNQNNLVGRYFSGHPHFQSAKLYLDTKKVNPSLYFRRRVENAVVKAVLGLSDDIMRKEQLLNITLNLNIGKHPSQGVQSLNNLIHGKDNRDIDLTENILNILKDLDHVTDEIYKKIQGSHEGLFSNQLPFRETHVEVKMEQSPNPDSTVKLSNDLDVFGQQKVVVDWRLNGDEYHTAKRANEILSSEIGRLGLGRLKLQFGNNDEKLPGNIRSWGHHMGTTRMSENRKKGVVDKNCLVYGTRNLYIAGASVFPTYSYVNPTLTIVALAIRLSDHLKDLLEKD